MEDQNFWRKCVVCKKEINFSTKYYKCSVSSCDKKRSPAQFCSVECWDVHRSIMGHKSAGAEEYHSPTKSQWQESLKDSPRVRLVASKSKPSTETNKKQLSDSEVLVVVSKLKAFVKENTGLNTSADVIDQLSDEIRDSCLKAAQSAHREGRKTLMAKDFR